MRMFRTRLLTAMPSLMVLVALAACNKDKKSKSEADNQPAPQNFAALTYDQAIFSISWKEFGDDSYNTISVVESCNEDYACKIPNVTGKTIDLAIACHDGEVAKELFMFRKEQTDDLISADKCKPTFRHDLTKIIEGQERPGKAIELVNSNTGFCTLAGPHTFGNYLNSQVCEGDININLFGPATIVGIEYDHLGNDDRSTTRPFGYKLERNFSWKEGAAFDFSDASPALQANVNNNTGKSRISFFHSLESESTDITLDWLAGMEFPGTVGLMNVNDLNSEESQFLSFQYSGDNPINNVDNLQVYVTSPRNNSNEDIEITYVPEFETLTLEAGKIAPKVSWEFADILNQGQALARRSVEFSSCKEGFALRVNIDLPVFTGNAYDATDVIASLPATLIDFQEMLKASESLRIEVSDFVSLEDNAARESHVIRKGYIPCP